MSHCLHMSGSQNYSDTPPDSNSQWYTTYEMFERKTCVKNKIIKNGDSKHLDIVRTPPCLKARELMCHIAIMQQIWHINRITKHIHHQDQEKQLEYLSRRTGVGRAEWKSFAANVPVAKKLICRGFERYSRQSFGPNVRYLHNVYGYRDSD